VWLITEFADFFEHRGFIFFRDVGFKDNYHIDCLGIAGVSTKNPQVATCGWVWGFIGLAQPHTPARRAKVKPARKAVPKVKAAGLH
jgi:hypothetical protein